MNPMTQLTVKTILTKPAGTEIEVRGWVKSARHSKNVTFLAVSDGSCFADLQVVVSPELANFESEVKKLVTGCSVIVSGVLSESPGGKQSVELQASSVNVTGWVEDDYPLQKKQHSFEFLRTKAHLRMRTNTFGALMRVRNAASRAIHHFFQSRGFIWLHSPIITASDCEGAGQMFRVSTLDAENPPRTEKGAVDWSQDFFGTLTHLTVSGQLEGETAALALKNIYTFGPTFRAENSNTSRHLAEFWMVEPEMAFCDLSGDAEMAEAFLQSVFKTVLNDCADDLEFFDQRIQPGVIARLQKTIDTPFVRMPYTEAIAALEKSGKDFEYPVHWGMDMQSEHERYLTEEHVGGPVVVTDYPRQIKAFYMYLNDDEKTVRAMDVLVPEVGEMIGGSQREDRIDVLRMRMNECGLDTEHYVWYMDLRRFGGVPHAGFGLGFERMVQYMTGMANIRDVIPYPRVPGHADF